VVGREVLSFRRESKPKDSTITGSNTIKYQVVQEYNRMQIDCRTFEIYSNSGWCRVKVYREGMSFIELIALKAGCDKGTYRFLWR
jgi:hypothetical protein